MKFFTLFSPAGAKSFRLLRNYAFCLTLFPAIGLALWLTGIIQICDALLVVGLFLLIIVALLWQYYYYKKIVFSEICFRDETIDLLDQKGNTWRSFPYSQITKVKIEELSGMFHGYNGISTQAKYIVLFFNHCETVPESNFKAKFQSNDFFPILYRKEIWDVLAAKMNHPSRFVMMENNGT